MSGTPPDGDPPDTERRRTVAADLPGWLLGGRIGCFGLALLALGTMAGAAFFILVFVGDDDEDAGTDGGTAIPTLAPTTAAPADSNTPARDGGIGTRAGTFSAISPNDSDLRFGDKNVVLLDLPPDGGLVNGSFELIWSFAANLETEFVFDGSMEGTYDADTGTITSGELFVTDESSGYLRFEFAEDGAGTWEATVDGDEISGSLIGAELRLSFAVPLSPN